LTRWKNYPSNADLDPNNQTLTRSKSQTERQEQTHIISWFKLKYPDTMIVASANGYIRGAKQAKFAVIEGVVPGMPDLQIIKPSRNYYGAFIELKRAAGIGVKKGVVSKKQLAIIDSLKKNDYYATVSYGLVEAKSMIEWYMDEAIPDEHKHNKFF